MMKSFKWARN